MMLDYPKEIMEIYDEIQPWLTWNDKENRPELKEGAPKELEPKFEKWLHWDDDIPDSWK